MKHKTALIYLLTGCLICGGAAPSVYAEALGDGSGAFASSELIQADTDPQADAELSGLLLSEEPEETAEKAEETRETLLLDDEEMLPEDTAPEVGEGSFVLMNIPYDKFYEGEGISGVDAVSSATKNKPRTGGLAGGSYHVDPEGTDISGVIYPVLVDSLDSLAGYTQITDESSVDITVTNRGRTTTSTYAGKDALFESPSYSYYVLPEAPAVYKTLTVSESGEMSFSATNASPSTVSGVTGQVKYNARHANIEISLSGTEGITQGQALSGVIVTTDDGAYYALRHVKNIWRATEIGWNYDDNDIYGKTITNIRYITQDQVIDYPVDIKVMNSGYVLMNIPYDKFYEGEGISGVDAVSSATKNKPRTGGLAGGSYHVDPEGSDISGVIYPVYVEDMNKLSGYTVVTDESSVDITVTNRGQTTTSTYAGKDALFESPSYSYYVLPEAPAVYKTLTVSESGELSFSATNASPSTVSGVTGQVKYNARHANIEISLSGTEGITQGQALSGVIVTTDDGASYALRHVKNIWRATEIGWNYDDNDIYGKTITNIRYITQDQVIDYPANIKVAKIEVKAEGKDFNIVKIDGVPEDAQNVLVTVSYTTGEGEEAVVTAVAENAALTDGQVVLPEDMTDGQTYDVVVTSDVYTYVPTSFVYKAPEKKPVYRLFNLTSGEHFYTTNAAENESLIKAGWRAEGQAWNVQPVSGTKVYRLYNPTKGFEEHLYTADENEVKTLTAQGWSLDGPAWVSDPKQGVAIYRLFNPKARCSAESHLYTKDENEKNVLSARGWRYEGIAWYGAK